MLFAEIQNNLVVNVCVWDENPLIENFVDITNVDNVGIGWSYVNGEFIEPPKPTPTEE